MKDINPIHRMTHRIVASLKSILKSACCIGLPLLLAQGPLRALYLPDQPGRGYPIASLTPAELAAWKESIASAEKLAVAAKNHLGFAQTSAQQQNVGGVRQGCEGARTAALAAVASANRANALALSIAATTSAQNATAWANQAANLLRIFTTPPAPLPTPRRILVPASEIDNPANLKNKMGFFLQSFTCCGQTQTGNSSGSIVGRFVALGIAHSFYQPKSGFASKVSFHRNPEGGNVGLTIYTAAVRRGYRNAINNRNEMAAVDLDIGVGMPSAYWPFTPLFTNNGPLRTAKFDPNFQNAPSRVGVATPYRAFGYVGDDKTYKTTSTSTATMQPVLQSDGDPFGSLVYINPGITVASSGFGPGSSGGPLIRESHQSGFLWGGYSYLEVVGIVKGGIFANTGNFLGFKVFDLTDLYFIDYYIGSGPGVSRYNPDGLDERYY